LNNELNLIVLIKQVPEIDKVKFDIEKGRIDRSSAKGVINPFDLNAIEAAVQIKERIGGNITAISMGPPQAISSLREAISRGVDRAILLSDNKFAGADTLATSYTLACAIKKIKKFDIIICGEKTVDGDTGQVGAEVAEHLNIPHASYVSKIIEYNKEHIIVLSEMGAYNYIIKLNFPCLISVTKDINTPRLPTFKDLMKARKAEIEIWDSNYLSDIADINKFGIEGSPTRVIKIAIPKEEIGKCKIFRGEIDNIIPALVEELGVILKLW
jgi:electron transfer flavoprotein beta subunit